MLEKSRGAELLKAWRERSGLTQAQVSFATGIDHGAICAFETGYRKPGAARAKQIAEATKNRVPVSSWSRPAKGTA